MESDALLIAQQIDRTKIAGFITNALINAKIEPSILNGGIIWMETMKVIPNILQIEAEWLKGNATPEEFAVIPPAAREVLTEEKEEQRDR